MKSSENTVYMTDDFGVWKERIAEKDAELERLEANHNSQLMALLTEIKSLKETKSRLDTSLNLKEQKLTEAYDLISDMRKSFIQQELERDAVEAEAEIRRRAKCDRGSQCSLLISTGPSNSFAREGSSSNRSRPESIFLSLAQQERDRLIKNTVTTSLSQTDPVVILNVDDANGHVNIPSLNLPRSLSPDAAVALTERATTSRDEYFVGSSLACSSGLPSVRGLLSSRLPLAGTLRESSPDIVELNDRRIPTASEHTVISNRGSYSPGMALNHGCEALEEGIDTDLVICEYPEKIQCREIGVNTDPVTLSIPRIELSDCLETKGRTLIAYTPSVLSVLRTEALEKVDVIAGRAFNFFQVIKTELDNDGHFAAVFVTGLIACLMFSR